ncbi:MAG TPA: chromate efflux transporter [Hyphomicrobiaceae bacterium]|nr:chromate efflux transporter [Hyphomicrobiaceae bacterium]
MNEASQQEAAATSAAPTFAEALRVWVKIGVLSFGGPAGQIALMHRVLVDEKKWIDEQRFLAALNFCMLLPGPEATQLATYVGWRLHGVKGGAAAGLLFVMPGALVILALSMLYGAFGNLPLVEGLFVGIKAAVLAIVMEALLRISRRALKSPFDWTIAGAAFVAIFFLAVPFPLVVLAAALAGMLGSTRLNQSERPGVRSQSSPVSAAATLRTIGIWLAMWFLPLLALVHALPDRPVLGDMAVLYSKLAVVTFGGAYAVLTYIADQAVNTYGWLEPGEMVDGLGLAETTPGPLILVNAFVAYLGALRSVEEGGSMVTGVLGWAVALWATFAPCFLWIFAGAPYIDRLNAQPLLKGALGAITAAVVGVILNLTIWFALNVLFAAVSERHVGLLRLYIPDPETLVWPALALSAVAFFLLLVLRRGIITTLALCGALAFGWTLL